MQQKIKLSADKILEKKFNIDFKGYSGQEVDEFLDEIVSDYDAFNATINELAKILTEYEAKIEQLVEENQKLKRSVQPVSEITSSNQLELLKRIAKLEEAVFKK